MDSESIFSNDIVSFNVTFPRAKQKYSKIKISKKTKKLNVANGTEIATLDPKS